MKKISKEDFKEVAKLFNMELAMLQTFWKVEGSGEGFDDNTGKILIQFEPEWFKKLFFDFKKSPKTNAIWQANKVEVQSREWIAFNAAFSIDPDAAMQATSIGAPQIMGFHYKRLGFKTVGDMWTSFKQSEKNQLIGLVKFIQTDKKLMQAVRDRNFHLIACYYNGFGYKKFAAKHKTVPYNVKLHKAYVEFSDVA